MGRKTKSSISVSLSRPHVVNLHRVPVTCSIKIHRQQNGRLGSSSTSHTLLSQAARNDISPTNTNLGDSDQMLEGTEMDLGAGNALSTEDSRSVAKEKPPLVRSV